MHGEAGRRTLQTRPKRYSIYLFVCLLVFVLVMFLFVFVLVVFLLVFVLVRSFVSFSSCPRNSKEWGHQPLGPTGPTIWDGPLIRSGIT